MVTELLGGRQEVPASTQQSFSVTRQPNPAAGALEEPDAQLGLEGVDLSPERGLRDVESDGRPRERPGIGHGDKIAEAA